MQNSINQKSDRGFTLLELMIVLFIVGIIAVIASPSFIGLLNRVRVNNSLETLLGAIKETQRLAIRQGRRCQININPNTNLLTATPSYCLLSNRNIDESVNIRTNLSGSIPYIYFSHKGNTTRMGTIVLSSNFTDTQKCFVISLGLGIMRTGEYEGSKEGRILHKKCSTSDD